MRYPPPPLSRCNTVSGRLRYVNTKGCPPSSSFVRGKLRYRRFHRSTNPAFAHLPPAEIALVAVFSVLVIGIMIFCLHRFCPGLAWRRRGKADSQSPSIDVKQTFLDLDHDSAVRERSPSPAPHAHSFLHLDENEVVSEKRGLGIAGHPALTSLSGPSKRKHRSNGHASLDSSSSSAPLIRRTDQVPPSPPRTYSPRVYSPKTPPPVPGTSTEPRRPCQHQSSRYDISPLQSSASLPPRSQLPMSFLIEIDAKREDQTGARSQTVSPIQNPPTSPTPDRSLSESQLSSRNISPVSAPSTTPVIAYPSATPVYLPRPFSKYNPYRPALEPAGSNWPLENTIPENAAMRGSEFASPVPNHLSQSPWKPQQAPSPAPAPATITTIITAATSLSATSPPTAAEEGPVKAPTVTHPEMDTLLLEQFHRRRRQQQKAREEQQQKKKQQQQQQQQSQKRSEKRKQRRQQQQHIAATTTITTLVGPAKKSPAADSSSSIGSSNSSSKMGRRKENGTLPPSNNSHHNRATDPSDTSERDVGLVTARPRSRSLIAAAAAARRARGIDAGAGAGAGAGAVTGLERKKTSRRERERKGLPRSALLPPRLPSKSRKPSQSPGAYEKARRISGLHELVGCSAGKTA